MGYISAREGAQLTGYTQQYITSLARDEKIKAQRLGEDGTVWLIDKDSLLAYAKRAQNTDDGRFGPGQ